MTAPRPAGKAPARKAAPRKAAPRKAAPAQKAAARKAVGPEEAGAEEKPPSSPPSSPAAVPAPASTSPPPASRSGWRALVDPSSPALVYVGVVAVVAGFALLFLAWSEVAAQADVWRQMPFVVSAGFPGLGLIMTGLVLASVGVRRQEGIRRQRQMAALTEALRSAERRGG